MSTKMRESVWDRDGVIAGILESTKIPRMAKVQQLFDKSKIEDIPKAIEAEFNRPEIAKTIVKGANIAITAGSRGIANIGLLTREIVRNVKRLALTFYSSCNGEGGNSKRAKRDA